MEPSCHHEFSRKFLNDHFKLRYLQTQYLQHLNTLAVHQERPKLPQTQQLIGLKDRHHKRQKAIRLQLQQNPENVALSFLDQFYSAIATHHLYADETTEPQEPITSHEELDHHIHFYDPEQVLQSSFKEYAHQYHLKCPSADCRGLITPEYQCGICHVQVCPDCHEVVNRSEAPHQCDSSVVKSIQTISQETKPCPTCHVPIYKTEGCIHMWCVQCHTAFSWKTGNPIQKFHNPHHQEWLESRARETAAASAATQSSPSVPFGRGMFLQIREHLKKHLEKTQRHPIMDFYLSLCNGVVSLETILYSAIHITRFEFETNELRENYLRGNLPETDYHFLIGKAYRDLEYHTETNPLLQQYVDQMKETFGCLLEQLNLLSAPDSATCLSILYKYTRQMERVVHSTEDLLEQCSNIHWKAGFFKFICKNETRTVSLVSRNVSVEFERILLALAKRTPSGEVLIEEEESGPPVTYLTEKFRALLEKTFIHH
jgi:hypothetical protein